MFSIEEYLLPSRSWGSAEGEGWEDGAKRFGKYVTMSSKERLRLAPQLQVWWLAEPHSFSEEKLIQSHLTAAFGWTCIADSEMWNTSRALPWVIRLGDGRNQEDASYSHSTPDVFRQMRMRRVSQPEGSVRWTGAVGLRMWYWNPISMSAGVPPSYRVRQLLRHGLWISSSLSVLRKWAYIEQSIGLGVRKGGRKLPLWNHPHFHESIPPVSALWDLDSSLHSPLHAAVCLSMALITLLINVILPTFCFSVPLEPTNKTVL